MNTSTTQNYRYDGYDDDDGDYGNNRLGAGDMYTRFKRWQYGGTESIKNSIQYNKSFPCRRI